MLTEIELSQIRQDIELLLPETGTILTRVLTPDGMGGNTETWTTASTEPCRLDYKSGVERLSGGALQAFTGWMVTLPYDAVITTSNRISINSTTYNIRSVNTGQSWIGTKRCEVEKVV